MFDLQIEDLFGTLWNLADKNQAQLIDESCSIRLRNSTT